MTIDVVVLIIAVILCLVVLTCFILMIMRDILSDAIQKVLVVIIIILLCSILIIVEMYYQELGYGLYEYRELMANYLFIGGLTILLMVTMIVKIKKYLNDKKDNGT